MIKRTLQRHRAIAFYTLQVFIVGQICDKKNLVHLFYRLRDKLFVYIYIYII